MTAATTPLSGSRASAPLIDPRGPRFGAAISSALLAAIVLLGASPAGLALLALAVVLFAIGSVRGAQGTPQGIVYRRWVQPRLGRPEDLEDSRPPRFAQTVGLVVTGTGLVLGLLGAAPAVTIAAAIALVAAFLNAALGFCLGCEIYLLVVRLRSRQA